MKCIKQSKNIVLIDMQQRMKMAEKRKFSSKREKNIINGHYNKVQKWLFEKKKRRSTFS